MSPGPPGGRVKAGRASSLDCLGLQRRHCRQAVTVSDRHRPDASIHGCNMKTEPTASTKDSEHYSAIQGNPSSASSTRSGSTWPQWISSTSDSITSTSLDETSSASARLPSSSEVPLAALPPLRPLLADLWPAAFSRSALRCLLYASCTFMPSRCAPAYQKLSFTNVIAKGRANRSPISSGARNQSFRFCRRCLCCRQTASPESEQRELFFMSGPPCKQLQTLLCNRQHIYEHSVQPSSSMVRLPTGAGARSQGSCRAPAAQLRLRPRLPVLQFC